MMNQKVTLSPEVFGMVDATGRELPGWRDDAGQSRLLDEDRLLTISGVPDTWAWQAIGNT